MGINLRESYFYVQGTTLKFSSHLESKNGGTNIYLGLNIKEIQYQEGPKRKQTLVCNPSVAVIIKHKLFPSEDLLQCKISQH